MSATYNNHNNDGYGNNKKRNTASGGNGKSAYEIRTDILKLALDLHLANLSKTEDGQVFAEDVVKTANTFNEFISKKNDR